LVTEYPITIKRERRKSLVMRMTTAGVLVLIPRWLKPESPQVQQFIANGLKKLQGRTLLSKPEEKTSVEELKAWVWKWAALIGVEPKRIQIRAMYRKWGSCSKAGSITLNQSLLYVPPHLAEYVVCHELVHMIEFNHCKGFKELMSHHMPDWTARDKELDKYVILRPA
jgi:predicted metal-dependent hydrolase